ncbi:hypothetical protein [Salipaludibacillus aurantiacus]|uniref:Phage major capsid protein, HK97 family n=1 Tax=Salipaludibacillus aurantiacus TaxID=1601833 RepID=A0A1H9U0R4_9BACI|nr:hypothetical protein [Salipaludibacillus aurantiacus]SES02754.1 hypothetical protein SAMN05518684_106204 [Salipaludibacillus aurantiacus]
MPNAINYATKYERELAQIIQQGSLTSELETPNVNWLDAQSFKVPTLTVSGYKNHSRNGGYNRGDVETNYTTYTLSFDRDIEFFVDKADVDESNQAASAANLTRVFLQEKAIPEMDAYRLSKMATKAIDRGSDGTASEEVTKANVYGKLKAAILPVRKYGPQNVIVYVSSLTMDALEQAENFTRKIEMQASGPQAIESRVTSIDGVRIIEVWDDQRFHTEYDFSSGFEPTAEALEINYLVVAKPSIIAKPKISSIYLFEPGAHTQGDGYLYQNRMYHDLFVKEHRMDGVFVSTKQNA